MSVTTLHIQRLQISITFVICEKAASASRAMLHVQKMLRRNKKIVDVIHLPAPTETV